MKCIQLIKLLRSLLTFILFITVKLSLFGQNYHINYEHITTKQGLSNNWVWSIIQDKFGFIWIATKDGLNRYDGYKFQIFTTEHNLPDNNIYHLAKDKEDNIWIATEAGLAKWNISTEEFVTIPFFTGKTIQYIYIDTQEQIWLASDNIVYCIKKNKNIVKTYLNNFEKVENKKIWKQKIHGQEEVFSESFIKKLSIFQIHYFNRKKQQWELILESQERLVKISSSGQFFILPSFQNSDKKASIQSYNSEIVKNIKFVKFPTKKDIDAHNELDLFLEKPHIEWVINQARMIAINWQKNEIAYYDKYFRNQFFFLKERFVDKSGTVWFTSVTSGIFILPRHQNHNFKYYSSKPGKLSGTSARAIYQDNDKNLWISTYNDNGVLDIFLNNGTHETFEIGGVSFKITPDVDKNMLWIGSDDKLLKVNKFTKQIVKKYENLGDYPRDILITKSQKLYLVNHDFFGILDLKTEKLKKYSHIKGSTCLLQTKDKKNWIGSKDKGIGLLDTRTMKVEYFSCNKDKPKSISSNNIKHIYEDTRGRLWIATALGLNLFDRKNKTFTYLTQKDGLPDDMIYAILEDKQGNLWLSTNKGISEFNPKSKRITNYNESYGLQDNEFNTNSFFKNEESGELFFGGIDGVNSFFPKNMKTNELIPTIILTKFKQKGKTVKLNKPFPLIKKIELNYDEAQDLTFEFTALSFFQSKRNQYAYKIEEIHEDWVYLDNKNQLILTNLNVGTYTLRIKGSNNNNIWNEKGLTIILIINPPFWQTWWFRSILLLLFLILLYSIYHWRIYQIRKREKILESEVDIRTKEIKKQAKTLEKQAEELDELNKTKDRLFAIIAHDLRSPMSTFESITQQLDFYIEQNEIKRVKELNQYIKQSSNSLNNLLNNLLSWALMQKNIISYQPQNLNLKTIIEQVLENYAILINNYQIQTIISIEDNLEIYADENALRTILRNIINNAIKFTSRGGTIEIESYEDTNYIIIEIKDTGKGIPEEKIQTLFKTENISKTKGMRGEKGTGLGLVLVGEFMEMHQGQIQVLSKENEGTKILLKFPKVNK